MYDNWFGYTLLKRKAAANTTTIPNGNSILNKIPAVITFQSINGTNMMLI